MSESFELNGTTWVFNNSLDFSFNDYEELILSAAIKVPFTDSANNNWDGMIFESPSGSSDPNQINLSYAVDNGEGSVSDVTLVYDIENDLWDSSSSKTITFSGEPSTLWGTSDAGIYQFYDWLEANATEQTEPEVINYLATSTDLISVANAIRTKGGTNSTLSFPSGFITAINNISGGLSPDSAVIHVTAPVGSTISFSKGGVVAKVLGPEKSHVNAEDNTLADWYYSVSSSNYGAWSITATLSSYTASKTITIDNVRQYDVVLRYNIYIIEQGVRDTSIPQALLRMTESSGEIGTVNGYRKYTQNTKTEPLYVSFGPIDLTNYKTISITMRMTGWPSGTSEEYKDKIGVGTTVGGYTTVNVPARNSSKTTKTLDVSNLSQNYYITLRCTWSSNTPTFYIYDLVVLI